MASQLTIEERQRISQLRFTEGLPTRIGKAIGRDKSVGARSSGAIACRECAVRLLLGI